MIGLGLCLFISVGRAEPVRLQVVDGDVRLVLASLARLGGLGLVLDDSVQGTVTIAVDSAEPADIVAKIAAVKGLLLEEVGGVTMITALPQAMYRPYVFPIDYAELATVREAVALVLRRSEGREEPAPPAGAPEQEISPEAAGGAAGAPARLLADPGTNRLLLWGTAAEAEAARAVVAALDQPVGQISLEAKVVALQKDAAKELGISWEWSKAPQYPEHKIEYQTRRRLVEQADGSYAKLTEDWPQETTERIWRRGEPVPGIIQFGRGPEGYPFEFYYAAALQALITDGKAKILARPNITTLQGREAVINIGGEVPVPKVSSTNTGTTTSIEYREAGIILRCTPRLNQNGEITAAVHTEVSSPLYVEALRAYRFQKRSADTVVRLRDGETMVIGGLIGSEETKSLAKVPFLGDLPILGAFFRSARISKSDSEIMIFLTAHILDDSPSRQGP